MLKHDKIKRYIIISLYSLQFMNFIEILRLVKKKCIKRDVIKVLIIYLPNIHVVICG